MIKKKKEIILSQEMVSLNEFKDMIKENIFPLCISLNNDEKQDFKNNKNIGESDLVNELYHFISLDNFLFLDGYVLRKKIEDGEVYVNKFLDDSRKVKYVKFIAPAFGHDLDCPKVVLRKTPIFFFKKMDHFSTGAKYDGKDILELCFETISNSEETKKLIKTRN